MSARHSGTKNHRSMMNETYTKRSRGPVASDWCLVMTNIAIENGHLFTVTLPMRNGDFPYWCEFTRGSKSALNQLVPKFPVELNPIGMDSVANLSPLQVPMASIFCPSAILQAFHRCISSGLIAIGRLKPASRWWDGRDKWDGMWMIEWMCCKRTT